MIAYAISGIPQPTRWLVTIATTTAVAAATNQVKTVASIIMVVCMTGESISFSFMSLMAGLPMFFLPEHLDNFLQSIYLLLGHHILFKT